MTRPGVRRLIAVLAAVALAAPALRAAEPPAAAQGDPWAPAHESLMRFAEGGDFQEFQIREEKSAYVAWLQERSAAKTGLKQFHFHGLCTPARGGGRMDRFFLAREGDGRLYDTWDDADLVALGHAQRIRLADAEAVRKFFHVTPDFPLRTLTPVDPRSLRAWRLHIGTSGVPGPGATFLIELDQRLCPARIRDLPPAAPRVQYK